ncbi:MAG: hypothetical protein RIF41_07580 [Polyangiaceae bacterium]
MRESATLFDVYAVHCFFGCGHVVREHDSDAAHDAMEKHYAAEHRHEIDRIVAIGKGENNGS